MTLVIITKDLRRHEYHNIFDFCYNSRNGFLLFKTRNKDVECILAISMHDVEHYSIVYKGGKS